MGETSVKRQTSASSATTKTKDIWISLFGTRAPRTHQCVLSPLKHSQVNKHISAYMPRSIYICLISKLLCIYIYIYINISLYNQGPRGWGPGGWTSHWQGPRGLEKHIWTHHFLVIPPWSGLECFSAQKLASRPPKNNKNRAQHR